jgi:putative sigma-54 modulation protein
MKVSYRGVSNELPPKLQEKLDAKFAKLSKMLEQRGEKEAHVILTNERHLHKAEITVQFYDHALVGAGADADVFTAMSQALDKLEKQAVKTRTKWREKKRHTNGEPEGESSEEPAGEAGPSGNSAEPQEWRVFVVNHHERRKPMTLDEAIIELEGDPSRIYVVYRDAEKECVSVLVRRKDGNFDLIES